MCSWLYGAVPGVRGGLSAAQKRTDGFVWRGFQGYFKFVLGIHVFLPLTSPLYIEGNAD